ncbi:MAG: hypothetical protein WCD18_04990 [Thermosynechococcaceae cyanobacterium]
MKHNATAALIELREHYQSLLAQCDQSSAYAKAQLKHVEALLLEALLPAPELPTHNATLIVDQPSPPKAIAPHPESAAAPDAASAPTPVAAAKPTPTEAIQRDTGIPVNPNPVTNSKGKAPASKPAIAKTPSTQTKGRDTVLALPTEYEGLRKIDAVALILENNPGNPIHIDTIIDKLYGTLPKDVHKAEKVRMSNVMARGIKDKLWKKAIAPGCYIATVGEPEPATAKASPKAPAKASRPRSSQSGNARKRPAKVPASLKAKKES